MRLLILFPVFFFYFNFASAQNKSGEVDPPGTIQLSENLFIDKVPVTNLMFLEYLSMKDYLKSNGYDSWKNYYTEKNETNWRRGISTFYPAFLKELEGEESLLSGGGYFWDPLYQETPVLRITQAQAEDYCQWRTEMVEYAWNFSPKLKDQKKFAAKIQYRLPSAEELEEAQIHFSEKDQLVIINQRNPLRYKPSADSIKFTLYNISEYTSSDTLYGENWKKVVPNKFPNDFTGFRCVCVIKK